MEAWMCPTTTTITKAVKPYQGHQYQFHIPEQDFSPTGTTQSTGIITLAAIAKILLRVRSLWAHSHVLAVTDLPLQTAQSQ